MLKHNTTVDIAIIKAKAFHKIGKMLLGISNLLMIKDMLQHNTASDVTMQMEMESTKIPARLCNGSNKQQTNIAYQQ